jgi:hypothetical protein
MLEIWTAAMLHEQRTQPQALVGGPSVNLLTDISGINDDDNDTRQSTLNITVTRAKGRRGKPRSGSSTDLLNNSAFRSPIDCEA